jgi:hypothetical protein
MSVDLAAILARRINQAFDVETTVFFRKAGLLTVIAPLDNVLKNVREIQPCPSWHGRSSYQE